MRIMLATIVCTSLVLAGCSFKRPRLPRVHKLTVQQGNVINQDMIDKLRPGMSRSQVAFVMGEPVVRNSFNDQRWDYVYTIELPGVYSTSQTVSLYFVDEQLAYFTGDLIPSRIEQATAEQANTEEAAAEEGETQGSD
jgi:outer membrane protein assembly factor BamE